MNTLKKLPDAEFEIMKIVWANEPPITTAIIMEQLGSKREWKAQTVLTLLSRLVEREFIRTEKNGKERTYYPLITKGDYLKFESSDFLKKFHSNSLMSLFATLYNDNQIDDNDLEELDQWLREKRD